MRNVVFGLVADQLARRPLQRLSGALVFDHQKGDSVHEADDVAAFGLRGAGALNRDLGGNLIPIVARILPVDVAEGKALAVAVDGLGDCGAENQRIVDILIGGHKALDAVRRRFQAAHGLVRAFQIEAVLATAIGVAIDLQQLIGQHIVQHHGAQASAAQAQSLRLAQWLVTQCNQHLHRRNLRLILLGGVEDHSFHPV